MAVRLDGIPYTPEETEDELKTKIEEHLKSVGVEVSDDMMVRFHRSGKPYVNANNETVAQTIVKFHSWKHRRQCHKGKAIARKKKLPFYITHDLTKRRYSLLKYAQSNMKGFNQKDIFAFADVNCNLVARIGLSFEFFNTRDEINAILNGIQRNLSGNQRNISGD